MVRPTPTPDTSLSSSQEQSSPPQSDPKGKSVVRLTLTPGTTSSVSQEQSYPLQSDRKGKSVVRLTVTPGTSTASSQEQSSPPQSDRKGKSVVWPTPTIQGKAKQRKRSFFGMELFASFLSVRVRQNEEEQDSDKENAPASLNTIKPLVARLPTFRENNEPITRRHTDSYSKPYSPKRLQNAKRRIKSAECNKTKSDWSKNNNKSSSRNLTPAFQALLHKEC